MNEYSLILLVGASKIVNKSVNLYNINKLDKRLIASYEQNYIFKELTVLVNDYIGLINSYNLL